MRARNRRSMYIEDEQWSALAEIAKREDRSVANIIRQAVGEFLGGHTRDVPPNQLSDTAPDDAGMLQLVPEPLGPDVRTTDEPVLPALKRTGGVFHPISKPKTP